MDKTNELNFFNDPIDEFESAFNNIPDIPLPTNINKNNEKKNNKQLFNTMFIKKKYLFNKLVEKIMKLKNLKRKMKY